MNNKEAEALSYTPVRSNMNANEDEERVVTSSSLLAETNRVKFNGSNEENEAVPSTSLPNQVNFNNEEEEEPTSSNLDYNYKEYEPTVSTTSPDQLESNAINKEDEENPNIYNLLSSTRCSICLKKMMEMRLAGLECCEHTFHIDCLSNWARINNTCPLDKKPFSKVNIIKKSIPDSYLRMGMTLSNNAAESRKATEEFKEQLKFLAQFSTSRQSKNREESSSAPSQ